MSAAQQRVAIVSGGNRGLGRATGEALAERGYHVVLGCRDVQAGETVAAALEGRGLAASAASLDVTSDQSVQCFARKIEDEFGRADVLVVSAGVILEPYDRTGVPEVSAPATVLGGDFDQARAPLRSTCSVPTGSCAPSSRSCAGRATAAWSR